MCVSERIARRAGRGVFVSTVALVVALTTACRPATPPATLIVTTTADGHDVRPGNGICEMTAGLGDCSVRAAIEEADAGDAPVTVITVPAGDYPSGDLEVDTRGVVIVAAASAQRFRLAGHVAITGGTVELAGATITDGESSGPGVAVSGGATAALVTTDVAGVTGVGVLVNGASLRVTSSSIHNSYGAGIVVLPGSAVALEGTTVSDNDAAGIAVRGPAGVRLTFTTVTGNGNGGLFGGGTFELESSVVGGQRAGQDCFGATTSDGFNLSSDGSCVLSALGDRTATPPQLGPLTTDALPAHHPRAGSPLIDAIPPGSGGCGSPSGPPDDQLGTPRPIGSGCDIGAIENPSVPAP